MDTIADAVYICLSNKPIKYTKEITPDILMDMAEDETPVGIDIQRWSELITEAKYRGVASEQNTTAETPGL